MKKMFYEFRSIFRTTHVKKSFFLAHPCFHNPPPSLRLDACSGWVCPVTILGDKRGKRKSGTVKTFPFWKELDSQMHELTCQRLFLLKKKTKLTLI